MRSSQMRKSEESACARPAGRRRLVLSIAVERVMVVIGLIIVGIVAISVIGIPQQSVFAEYDDAEDAGTHQANVEFLRQRGVLDGTECSQGRFCPSEPVQRWVMAVWLVRVLDGEDPKFSNDYGFVDVESGQWWRPYVERLAELEVTRGCSAKPLKFCPYDNLTRAQMASFLVRAYNLTESIPFGFVDTVENIHEDSINALAASGITYGCEINPPMYCPNEDVTRAQLGSLLARTITPDIDGALDGWAGVSASTFKKGEISVPVYYCAQATSRYTMSGLRDEVTRLNQNANSVRDFYMRQSSDRAKVNFVAGGIVSPAGVNWKAESITRMFNQARRTRQGSKCEQAAIQATPDNSKQIVVLADVPTGGQVGGYAWVGTGPVLQPPKERFLGSSATVVHDAILAHEIGHSVFNLSHPEDIGYPNECSLMSNRCGGRDLSQTYISDREKRNLGWDVVEPPGRVRGLMATTGRTSTVSWSAPDNDGGAPIEGYMISYRDTTDHKISTTSHVITGLRSGSYIVQVKAYNSQGSGPESQITIQIQGVDVPEKPASPTVTAGDGELVVSWVAPDDGGSRIIDYHVTYRKWNSNHKWISWRSDETSTALSTTITGLDNGVTYEVDVGAENAIGVGPYSDPTIGTPRAPSIAPIINDDPVLYDEDGGYSWWQPPANIIILGYDNDFWFTLAASNNSEVDNWARWDFDTYGNDNYEIYAWIPADWATAHVQYRIWADVDGDSAFESEEFVAGPWLDQQKVNGWQSLGTYEILSDKVRIEISDHQTRDDHRDVGAVNARLAVDAIKLQPR